jgi:hypothetical protein
MALGPLLVAFMAWQAWEKISAAAIGHVRTNMILQWSIILLVFIPICIGLMIFGFFGIKGDYDHLPES